MGTFDTSAVVGNALTVTAGGETITAGGFVVTAGGGTITGGGLVVVADASKLGGTLSVGGAVTGGSVTEGTATLSGGDLSSVGSIGATSLTASGAVTGGSVTDGTATLSGGTLLGLTRLQVNNVDVGNGYDALQSDRRLKENIRNITDAVAVLSAFRGVRFDWRANVPGKELRRSPADIGFIAQEIEEVLPELVMSNSTGYRSVSYYGVIPLLVECVREQQREIGVLRDDNTMLERRVASLEEKVKRILMLVGA